MEFPSGPPGTALNITSDATEIHTRAVAEKLQCAHGSDEEILSCLREIPMERLTDAAIEYSVNYHPPIGLFTFIPSVDGDIIFDRPTVLYKSGRFAKGMSQVTQAFVCAKLKICRNPRGLWLGPRRRGHKRRTRFSIPGGRGHEVAHPRLLACPRR